MSAFSFKSHQEEQHLLNSQMKKKNQSDLLWRLEKQAG